MAKTVEEQKSADDDMRRQEAAYAAETKNKPLKDDPKVDTHPESKMERASSKEMEIVAKNKDIQLDAERAMREQEREARIKRHEQLYEIGEVDITHPMHPARTMTNPTNITSPATHDPSAIVPLIPDGEP